MAAPEKPNHQEHPLANILINVLIPVLALSYLSKDPEFQQAIGKAVKPWHIGPVKALIVALTFPIGYGVWHFAKTRKANFFSALGLVSVLLTGGLTIFLWNKDGTVKPHADVLFGLKEASIPFILGLAVIGSHYTGSPLLRVFLYSDSLFDIPKIETPRRGNQRPRTLPRNPFPSHPALRRLVLPQHLLNFGLAHLFPRRSRSHGGQCPRTLQRPRRQAHRLGLRRDRRAHLVFLFFTLRRLLKSLGALTGFKDEEMMLPR